MDYNRIVAVTGLPGLYEVVSSKTDGAIVRSLEDQSTKFVSSRIHNLSHLESIEVYTIRENVTLADVFSAMKGGQAKLPDTKDNNALKSYFEKVFPDMDFDRVYSSDLKKMVKWYEVLDKNQVDFTVVSREEEEEPEETSEVAVAEKTKTKAAAKPKEAVKEKETAPAKKAAVKEKTAKAPAEKTASVKTSAKPKTEDKPKKAAKKK